MISLIKYELKRDRYKSCMIMIGVIICTYFIIPLIYPIVKDNNLLGMIIILGFLAVIDRRITHLANDTLFDNKEHMMLVPKSILQIVSANAIVAYMDCLIFTGILIGLLNVDISIKLLRGIVIVNVIFLVYVLFTCLYLLSGKIIKKPLFAAIAGLLTTISIIILSFLGRAVYLYFLRIEVATLFIGLLAILGILAIAASLGHKFYMRKKETKVMIIIGVLCIVSLGMLVHSYVTLVIENTDLPFIIDNQIIGKWETVDFVDNYEEYVPRQIEEDFPLKKLIFDENGVVKGRWQYNWTKGYVIHFPVKGSKSRYIIQEINGNKYLFVEWKSGDYIYLHIKPSYYVLKKVA